MGQETVDKRRNSDMTVDNTILGRCPNCDEPIAEAEMVIDYKSQRGNRVTAATCPSCVTVVTVV